MQGRANSSSLLLKMLSPSPPLEDDSHEHHMRGSVRVLKANKTFNGGRNHTLNLR